LHFHRTTERMTDMKSTNPDCLLRAGSSFVETTSPGSRPIDLRTTQAFYQLRLHAEELALELAVRLRVLGKSLASACPGPEAVGGKRTGGSAAYANIRRQLDGFFGSLVDDDLAAHHCFPVVREYIQETLPFELKGCADADPCRIELVEAVVSLLSESSCEDDGCMEGLMLSYSL
jgi:hypothetical protein